MSPAKLAVTVYGWSGRSVTFWIVQATLPLESVVSPLQVCVFVPHRDREVDLAAADPVPGLSDSPRFAVKVR